MLDTQCRERRELFGEEGARDEHGYRHDGDDCIEGVDLEVFLVGGCGRNIALAFLQEDGHAPKEEAGDNDRGDTCHGVTGDDFHDRHVTLQDLGCDFGHKGVVGKTRGENAAVGAHEDCCAGHGRVYAHAHEQGDDDRTHCGCNACCARQGDVDKEGDKGCARHQDETDLVQGFGHGVRKVQVTAGVFHDKGKGHD